MKVLPKHRPQPKTERTRVLYVEDEDENWEVAAFLLSDSFELVRARDAREAFEQLKAQSFSLILMDIQLKGSELNGIEITRSLKGGDVSGPGSSSPEIPIVFVTAYGARYDRATLLEAGGEDVISKPVDFTQLTLSLSRILMARERHGVLGV
jgi:CheY-like chemotaxis protein